MKKTLLTGLFALAGIAFASAQGLPTNPTPGKCYVKCITKDTYKTVEETIEIAPAYTKLSVTPATYKTVTEEVLIQEASKKFIYVPATYETVSVDYVKKASSNVLKVVPAVFGKDSKTIETKAKSAGWEYRVLEDCPSVNKDACVSACFVEYPAQFNDVALTTLVSDATTTSSELAAVNDAYSVKKIKTPARVDEVEIPAKYSTISKKVVDVPAATTSTTVDAEFKSITKTVLDQKGGVSSWAEVDCGLLDPTIIPIFYQVGSAKLTESSKTVIDNTLLPILNDKPVSIELRSHTDSRGNDAYNKSLSQQRANAVVNYLVGKGISRSRLSARGFGETKLVNRCSNGVKCSENEHQKNRRTEFRIINN